MCECVYECASVRVCVCECVCACVCECACVRVSEGVCVQVSHNLALLCTAFNTIHAQLRVFKQTKVEGFDASQFVTEQVFYKSKDGTRIPMFIVHRKGMFVHARLRECAPSFSIAVSFLVFYRISLWLFAMPCPAAPCTQTLCLMAPTRPCSTATVDSTSACSPASRSRAASSAST